jgi:hypothetical protein
MPMVFTIMKSDFEYEAKKGGILMKRITAVILVLAFLMVSVPVFAGTENDLDVAVDTVFARPLGIVSIVGGAALWIVSFPFAAISGNLTKTTETLITNPVKYTFARPIGDFDYGPASNDENKQ